MSLHGKQLLSTAELERAACEVYCTAQREGVVIALLGGYALQMHGSPRLTGDVDFAAERPLETMPVIGHLSFGGVKTVTSENVPVDLIVRDDDYKALYEEALEDASAHARGRMPVVRPEYLAAMKMASGRPGDMADLEFLIKENIVDVDAMRSVIRRHLGPYAAHELDQIELIARWRKSRE